MDIGAKAVKVGVTCDEIDRIIHEVCSCNVFQTVDYRKWKNEGRVERR